MTNTVYTVTATDTTGTPGDILYGSEQIVFADRAEAEARAEEMTADPCWGVDGTLTAPQVGFRYVVDSVDAEDLAGIWLEQAVELGLVLSGASVDERLEGLQGLTPADVPALRALLDAVDGGDELAAEALREVQDLRDDGDACGWRAVLSDWHAA